MSGKPDVGKLVDEMAAVVGLTIAPAYRDNVIMNFERSMAIVAPLLALELDDDLTAAPVFTAPDVEAPGSRGGEA